MSNINEIQELETKLRELKIKEENDKRKKEWDFIKNFFEQNKDRDFAFIKLDNKGNLESLYIRRVECVRHQPTFHGVGYMAVDYSMIQIGYNYYTKGFDDKYFLGKTVPEHPQDFSSFNKVKRTEPVTLSDLRIQGGFPLKSKRTFKKEYEQILTTGKIRIHTDSIEFTHDGGSLSCFTLGVQMIPKKVYDDLMTLYIKQTLESQDFLQKLDLGDITEVNY